MAAGLWRVSSAARACLPRLAATVTSPTLWRAPARALSAGASPTSRTEEIVQPGDAAAFKRVVLARNACKLFQTDVPIPADVMSSILSLTARAPSAFNLQPYVCVLVDDPSVKAKVADAMLGSNPKAVGSAPAVAVFAIDRDPARLLPAWASMMVAAGAPPAAVQRNVNELTILFGGPPCGSADSPLGAALQAGKGLVAGVLSKAIPVPSPPNIEAWAQKSASLAVQTLLLSAAAHGLSSGPMEGFDASRLSSALGLPARYSPSVVVALGYSAQPSRKSKRFDPATLLFKNNFGAPYPGVEQL